METNRIFSCKSGMGEVPIRLEDRLPAWWEMAGTVPEILDACNTEFLERDLYLERLLDEVHCQGTPCDNAESRAGYTVLS